MQSPLEYVEVARATTERGEVVLRRRCDPEGPAGSPGVLELRVNGVFVMDTQETTSEIELARAALRTVANPEAVLIGGLGLGFTAHEALADHRVRRVTVAEIEEPLVRWFRTGTVPHGPSYLADGRLTLSVADVRQLVAEAGTASFDLVLLDVDNGPDFLVHDSNAEIYHGSFLAQVARILRPAGAVAIWSSTRSEPLLSSLREHLADVEPLPLPVALPDRDETYWLHLARR